MTENSQTMIRPFAPRTSRRAQPLTSHLKQDQLSFLHRFGRLHEVVAAQPALRALREEATAVRASAYRTAASLLANPGRVQLEGRTRHLEIQMETLMQHEGTIDHIFQNINNVVCIWARSAQSCGPPIFVPVPKSVV